VLCLHNAIGRGDLKNGLDHFDTNPHGMVRRSCNPGAKKIWAHFTSDVGQAVPRPVEGTKWHNEIVRISLRTHASTADPAHISLPASIHRTAEPLPCITTGRPNEKQQTDNEQEGLKKLARDVALETCWESPEVHKLFIGDKDSTQGVKAAIDERLMVLFVVHLVHDGCKSIVAGVDADDLFSDNDKMTI